MTVTFVLKDKDSNTLKEYILQSSDKILDLKIMIVKDQYENKGNVNINLLIERTKRVFGKFNLEPGMLPVSFDNSSLDKFALKDGEIINISSGKKYENKEVLKICEKITKIKSKAKK